MLNEVWGSAVAGVIAGLGVAMPLGAIAALLLREGLVNGFRVAAAAAVGVATVDLLYCAVATATGTLLARTIESYRGAFLVVSGVLVVAIGVRQLHHGLKERGRQAPDVGLVLARTAYARFVGLTAVNPMTLVYFVALGGAVIAPSGSSAAPAAFVAAAGLSSLAWQLVLASVGSFFRGAVGARTARVIGIAASLLVLALGAAVLVNGINALARTAS